MAQTNTFTVLSWDEHNVHYLEDEKKVNRATVTQEYTGTLKGKSSAEYTMYYEDVQSSTFVGIESFEGTYDGKKGTLLFLHRGEFRDGIASSSFSVIDSLGELEEVTGTGQFATSNYRSARYSFTTH